MAMFAGVVEPERAMSNENEQSEQLERMDRILRCMERQAKALEENRDAMVVLSHRMDSFGIELSGIGDTLQAIARRQSDLEAMSEKRRVTCGQVMQSLTNRITFLENELTPIPQKLTAEQIAELYMEQDPPGNGSNGSREARMVLDVIEPEDEEDAK
jgi:hypothetical protein